MKLDTSSYYPDSPLDNDIPDHIEEQELQLEDTLRPAPKNEPPSNPAQPGIDLIANILSWVFVPLMMPVYGVMLIFSLSILSYAPLSSRIVFTLITLAINVLVPAAVVILLKRFGIVNDLGLNGRKERMIPYLICVICLLGTAWFMHSKGMPVWGTMFFVGGAVAGVIELIINFRWKISVHAAGVAGIVALLIRMLHVGYPRPELMTWLIISILITGLVGSARLWLGRHTPAQVLAGYIVGFCAVYFMTLI